jgi:hypothetical protein
VIVIEKTCIIPLSGDDFFNILVNNPLNFSFLFFRKNICKENVNILKHKEAFFFWLNAS